MEEFDLDGVDAKRGGVGLSEESSLSALHLVSIVAGLSTARAESESVTAAFLSGGLSESSRVLFRMRRVRRALDLALVTA